MQLFIYTTNPLHFYLGTINSTMPRGRPKGFQPNVPVYEPPKDVTKNVVLFRKIEDYGWYVVGYRPAKKMGMRFYATEAGVCARGHHSPMSVEHVKCLRCTIIDKRNKPKVEHKSKEEAREYWRQKLKLPREELCPENPRYVYVVENVPYTTLIEAEKVTGLTKGMIGGRCKNDSYLDYHQLPTKFTMWETKAKVI